ncbi:MAG: gliding motility protein GldN [Prevotella sp.]|nr:gliding motility protein GldN [Prevotella sp.]
MKYVISLLFSGLMITGSLLAQNSADNSHRMMRGGTVTNTAEDMVTSISSRELFLTENSMNNYYSATWKRDIYRDVPNIEGNETLFYPTVSTDTRVNLFSLIINLLADNTIKAYKYEDQPDFNENSERDIREVLFENKIAYAVVDNRTVSVTQEDIAKANIVSYFVKERWYYDIKTGKGDVRVVAICPVICDRGRTFPIFWINFDDISVYLARAISPVAITNVTPVLTNASIFDIFRNRYYKGSIYQVGMRNLSQYFTTTESLDKERARIEKELDYVQSRFDAVAIAHHED